MGGITGNDPRDLWALLGGVAALAGGLYAWTRRDDGDPGRIVATCADGSVIGERGPEVRRRLTAIPPLRAQTARYLAQGGARPTRETLRPGDLGAVRIREGRDREALWMVEGLDRERAEISLQWPFVDAQQAMAAYRLLKERVLDPAAKTAIPASVDAEFDRVLGVDRSAGNAGA